MASSKAYATTGFCPSHPLAIRRPNQVLDWVAIAEVIAA